MTEKRSLDGLRLRALLRDLFQSRGLTYGEAAKAISVSLATFKRMMTSGDFSFENVVALAEWLGYSVNELTILARSHVRKPTQYTVAQENYLAKAPISAYVHVRLLIGHSPKNVQAELGLSDKVFRGVLSELDAVKLIERLPDDRVRHFSRGPFQRIPGGPIEKAYTRSLVEVVVDRLVWGRFRDAKPTVSDGIFECFEFYSTESAFKDFIADLRSLIAKYRNRAVLERATLPAAELRPISGLLSFAFLNSWKEVFIDRAVQK